MTKGRRRAGFVTAIAIAVAAALLAARTSGTPDPQGARHPQGTRVLHITIASRYVHGRLPVTLVIPPGGSGGRTLLVFLHGRGGDQNSELSSQLFSALRALGAQAPDLAFPYGGDHSYWHDRAGGAWGSYVLREVIPAALRALHADSHRVAIGGISMGGFGAYDLARLSPGRFCAVGGHSAALWLSAGDTALGAFDDAADFARNDVIALARSNAQLYGHARLWLDGGAADPFHTADKALASALRINMRVWPGGHDHGYWNAHWGDYLRFYARACSPR